MLEDLQPKKRVGNCGIRALKATLSEDDAVILEKATKNLEWSVHGLTEALKKKGLSVGYQVVYRHRNGLCTCSRLENHA